MANIVTAIAAIEQSNIMPVEKRALGNQPNARGQRARQIHLIAMSNAIVMSATGILTVHV